jgi:hypothetical protein
MSPSKPSNNKPPVKKPKEEIEQKPKETSKRQVKFDEEKKESPQKG